MIPDKLPLGGIFRPAPEKRHPETVVFIHHFGGHRNSSRKHQDFILQLGFDVVSFNLSRGVSLSKALHGAHFLPEIWAEDLTRILDAVEGSKVLYSFSFPSIAAVQAIAKGRADISAWISDGGPFLEFYRCLWKYYTYQEHWDWLRRIFITSWSFLKGDGFNLNARMFAWLEKFPEGFPVLSIRAGQDRLVSPSAIDKVFRNHPNLQLTVLDLPDVGHLEGYFRCRSDYTSAVRKFLESYSKKT